MSENKDFHNSGGMLAFIGSITFIFIFFFYLVAINKGVDLGENVVDPSQAGVETVAFDLSAEKTPWVSSPQILAAGEKLFKQNCALCHGAKGDLVGGIPTARNLVEGNWKQPGVIGHFKVIASGIAGTQMAGFKAQLKSYERWALTNYVESISKNKSTDKAEDVAAFAKSAE